MRAVMVMYDSLNRHFLPNYGCDLTKMPNFQRLGEKTVTFDNNYVGSLPCMPARRELHTGRLNFLHRGWSPLEPFDDSMPEMLKQNGIHSHIISDHGHYWEDGGATYHTRYQTWEIVRGQEGDPWKGNLGPIETTASFGGMPANNLPAHFSYFWRQDAVNRTYMNEESQFPQPQTFSRGIEFIETNKDFDNWFLQIETFDPHEPFFSPEEYQALYREEGEEPFPLDWPPYGPVTEDEDVVAKVRKKYFALLSMCDAQLGRVLDAMDRYNMWKDTMLIVNTDHGYLLGEHLWWSKSVMPVYNEIAHTPLFIWDPRSGIKNERRQALTQTIDLAPTLLEYFGVDIPEDMQGTSLRETIENDRRIRDYALFGYFGSHINITDGRYLYMRAPLKKENEPLYEYTLMPTLMKSRMSPQHLKGMTLAEPFAFTKECSMLKLNARDPWAMYAPCYRFGNKLFDLSKDPEQLTPMDDPVKEAQMMAAMVALMKENDAPKEQYARMGLPVDGAMTAEGLLRQREKQKREMQPAYLNEFQWDAEAYWQFMILVQMMGGHNVQEVVEKLKEYLNGLSIDVISKAHINAFVKRVVPEEEYTAVLYTLETVSKLE